MCIQQECFSWRYQKGQIQNVHVPIGQPFPYFLWTDGYNHWTEPMDRKIDYSEWWMDWSFLAICIHTEWDFLLVCTRNRQSLEGKYVAKLTLEELNCFYEQVITLPCRIHETVLIKVWQHVFLWWHLCCWRYCLQGWILVELWGEATADFFFFFFNDGYMGWEERWV